MLVPQYGKSKNTKEEIIQILSQEWPLSAKKIHNKIKQHKHVTYQNVHKILQQLLEDNVVERTKNDNKKYQLKMQWIKNVKQYAGKLEGYYNGENEIPPVEKIFKQNYTSFSVDTIYKLYSFIIKLFTYATEEKNNIYVNAFHPWNPIFITENQLETVIDCINTVDFYGVSKYSMPLDKTIKNFCEKRGSKIKIKTGVSDCVKNCEEVVIGDYVFYLYYPEKLLNGINTTYENIESLEDMDFVSLHKKFYFKEAKINVVAHKNPEIAKQIRKGVLSEFKGKNKEGSFQPIQKTFKKQIDVGKFVIDFISRKSNGFQDKEPIYASWGFTWCPLTLSDTYYRKLRKLVSKNKLVAIINSNTAYDKWLEKNTWNKLGANMKTGMNCANEFDTVVFGDYVINVHWPEKLKELVNSYNKLENIDELDINRLYEDINDTKMDAHVIINKNPKVAKQLKKDISGKMKSNKITKQKPPESRTFGSVEELDNFLLDLLEKVFVNGNSQSKCYSYWAHEWWPLFTDMKNYKLLKNIKNKKAFYIAVKSNSPIEKWCLDFYKKLGMNAVIGKKLCNFDFIVHKDDVYQMIWPSDFAQEVDKTFEKIRDPEKIDIEKLYKNIFEKETNIELIHIQNKQMANRLKKDVINLFG